MSDRQHLLDALTKIAPGTEIRQGIDRVIRAGRGALLVLGSPKQVEPVMSGGFVIEAPTTAQRVAELAKMDGAIHLDPEGTTLLRANVHLVPDSLVGTSETGTRHRSAERVARQTGLPVVSVSESMGMVTLYMGDQRWVVEEVSSLLFRANQALATLERYRMRYDEIAVRLTARELDDAVSLRDVAVATQRVEMVRRIASEIEEYVVMLGGEGRLVKLQLDELQAEVDDERDLLLRDYCMDSDGYEPAAAKLDRLTPDDLLRLSKVATVFGFRHDRPLDDGVTPRGYRLLAKIPRLTLSLISRVVEEFETLPKLLQADVDALTEVDGVGTLRAHSIHTQLRRLIEVTRTELFW